MELIYFVVALCFVVFALIEAHSFLKYDGKMNRGMKVGSETLPSHLVYYLRNLSSDALTGQTTAFIKKHGEIVLIQPIPNVLHRNVGLWYAGLVDLSATEPQIDYRAPISGVLGLIILVGILLFQVFIGSPSEKFRAILVLLVMIPVLLAGHAQSKSVVLRHIENSKT